MGVTMAERPYITGAIAVGIVATALHLSSSSAPPTAPQSSITSLADTHSRHAITPSKTPADQVLWSTAMNNDPMNLGKVTAQKELSEAISDFYHPPFEPAAGTHKAAAETKPPSTPANSSKGSDELEVMIAIEPDPVHTHLSLLFDRDID